jgi:hypothetical protein
MPLPVMPAPLAPPVMPVPLAPPLPVPLVPPVPPPPVQTPAVQLWPARQAFPQAPQLRRSDCVLTQAPAQSSVPAMHEPIMHTLF